MSVNLFPKYTTVYSTVYYIQWRRINRSANRCKKRNDLPCKDLYVSTVISYFLSITKSL